MKTLLYFSLKQVVFYNLVFVLLIVAGAFVLAQISIERYPSVQFGEVMIQTFYPGASPADVEILVSQQLEEALESVQDIEFIESISSQGFSSIHLKFLDDTQYEDLFDEVRFKILSTLNELPAGIDPPTMLALTVDEFVPVISVNLAGPRSNRTLALIADELKLQLEAIEGVQRVNYQGEQVREFHVLLDPERMRQLGVTFNQVATALQQHNIAIPAGDFADSSGLFTVMVDEKFRSREAVLKTIVRHDGDSTLVRVADVIADAGLFYRDPLLIASINGENGITLNLIKSDHGNALTIVDAVHEVIEEYRPRLEAEQVQVVYTQDSTEQINDHLFTLSANMLLGICLVSLIIWYFMGFRNAALTTIGIPFAFMVTTLIMYFTGNSLNEISLFAFVLVTGIVVDDAIVVIENIYRHVEQGHEKLADAIVNGTAEVALPVIAATSTTVAAFMPMLIMSGSTGEFFAQIPMTVTYAIIASLIECLLILPIHYLDFGPRAASDGKAHEVGQADRLPVELVRRVTRRLLRIVLRFRWLSLSMVLLAFMAALAIMAVSISGQYPLIRIQFFPDNYSVYFVDIEAPPHTPVEITDQRVRAISQFLLADGPGMVSALSGLAGMQIGEDYRERFSHLYGTVIVTLPTQDKQAFADAPVNDPLAHLDWVRARLQAQFNTDGFQIRVRPLKDGPPTGKDVNIRVVGDDMNHVMGMAQALEEFLRTDPTLSPHLTDIANDRGPSQRVLHFQVDQERAHAYGLTTPTIASVAASVLDGQYLGKYRVLDEELDLKLGIASHSLSTPSEALNIPVLEHPSGPILLGDVTTLVTEQTPSFINRYQGQRVVTLLADILTGAPISTPVVVKRVKQRYAELRDTYPGVALTFGGAHESTQRSYTSLTYAFGLAILIMYMILATQFQSYVQPLIILSSVVFALIGVIFGSALTQSLFTVNSFIAVVGLTGVVVNNSLVMIDFMNRSLHSGLSRREAIEHTIHIRLRPILLTTLTTTLGLLPMALGIPSYSLVWGAMASTFVTGLAVATALTLFLVPVQWDLLEEAKARWKGRNGAAMA